MTQENIVIVGGGGAGLEVARALSAKLDDSRFKLILITPRPFYVHYPAGLRMIVTDEGNLEDRALIPLKPESIFAKGKGTLKIATVSSIQKSPADGGGSVILSGDETIPFKFLVLATGSKWEGPLQFPNDKVDATTRVSQWREKFKNAQTYVIVGAGAVGLELAGELRDHYPTKKITVVHAGTLPLNEAYPDKFRLDVAQRWRSRDIDLVFGDRIDEIPTEFPAVVTTANGKTITADIVVPTRGGKPNSEFIATLGPNVVDASGYVKVTDTLQVEGHPDVFAVGDIISYKEQKQLAKTPGHASVIVANILTLIRGSAAKKKYTGTFEAIVVTNGKNGGAGFLDILWGLTLGNKACAGLKSKALFVDKYRKTLGAPV